MRPRLRASVVCVARDALLAVRLEDPASRVVRDFLPGGAIEPGETPGAAAVRETLEETGYAVVLVPGAAVTSRYPFRWNGVDYDCTTHFFGARLVEAAALPAPVDDASYHRGVVWIPRDEVRARLDFHVDIWRAVESLLA
jgi:tRNA(adenine34) deaminase